MGNGLILVWPFSQVCADPLKICPNYLLFRVNMLYFAQELKGEALEEEVLWNSRG